MNKIIKNKIKSISRSVYQYRRGKDEKKYVYLVSSYGRSASTLLWHSVSESLLPGSFLLQRKASIIEDGLWSNDTNIDASKCGIVLKTHLRPEGIVSTISENNIKNIYIISKPSESIMSLINTAKRLDDDWFGRHMKNLGSSHIKNVSELIETDALDLENRIYDWDRSSIPTLVVKYENLWNDCDRLSDFLGRKIILPKKIKRERKSPNKEINKEIAKVYQKADEAYSNYKCM